MVHNSDENFRQSLGDLFGSDLTTCSTTLRSMLQGLRARMSCFVDSFVGLSYPVYKLAQFARGDRLRWLVQSRERCEARDPMRMLRNV